MLELKERHAITYLFLTAFLLCLSTTISAQEIVNALILESQRKDPVTGIRSGFNMTDKLINDNGRYYMMISRCDEEFHNLYSDVIEMDPIVTYATSIVADADASLLLEYTPGVGITDNTILNFESQPIISIQGDLVASATRFSSTALGYDNEIFYGDTIPEAEQSRFISVYDKANDSLLYNERFDYPTWFETAVGLDGDYLYVGTTFKHDGIVMFGDTLHHLVESFIQFTTVLQKVNWRTGELVWTRYTGSLEKEDTVREIKVLGDGSVMVEFEVSGPFSYEGVELDPPNYGNAELDKYNLVMAKFTPDGDYVDHVHLRSPGYGAFRYTSIEDDGSFLVNGIAPSDIDLFVGEEKIDLFTDKLSTGLLFSFDEHMDLKWHKTYYANSDNSNSNGVSIVFGANRIKYGESLCSVLHLDSTFVDGELYISEYLDWAWRLGQNLICHYDKDGNILSEPIPFGMRDNIFDFQQLADNHYMFFVESTYSLGIQYKPDLFGFEFDLDVELYNMVLEVKGDIFESITAVHELVSSSDLEVYPSPCHKGQSFTIKLEEELQSSKNSRLIIYDYSGEIELDQDVKNTKNLVVPTTSLSIGPKIVTIKTDKKIYKQSIIIY